MLSFFSRLHPLVVHLPIGLLSFALIISILPASRRARYEPAWVLSLALASIASLIACASGYLLRQGDAYDELLSSRHQWLGIATALAAFTAWLWPSFRRPMVWVASLLMMIAGHLGGTLTHGEGYLFASTLSESAVTDTTSFVTDTSAQLKSAAQASSYQPYRDEVAPILRSKCEGCHSSVKRKGGLRLDGEEWILKGGKNGKVLAPGDPKGSPMYSHLLLPMDDEMHMPPKGKRQLTGSEIAIIHRWVLAGAPFGSVARGKDDTLSSAPAPSAAEAGPAQEEAVSEPLPAPPSLPKPDASAVAALRMRGAVVQEVMSGSNGLYVNLMQAAPADDSLIRWMTLLREHVIELRAGGLNIGDLKFQTLPAFPNLRRLDLSRTPISPSGLVQMDRFPALEVLNLYGTSVGDGLPEALAPCSRLRKVYLWKTSVSEAGMRRLKAVFPALEIDGGVYAPIPSHETK